MGRSKKVTDDHLSDVLRRLAIQSEKEGERRRHDQAVNAGKELVLVCMMMEKMGAGVQGDLEVILADFLKNSPDAISEVLAFLQLVKDTPKLISVMLQGFDTTIDNGRLKIHYNWRTISDDDLEKVVKKLGKTS